MKSLIFRALACCAGLAAFAITFGEPDGNGHPYVGTLLFEQQGFFYSCTGTLLSSTIMLTAGHCTEGGGVVNANTWVTFKPQISFADALPGETTFPLYLNNPAHGWVKGQAIPHPNYDDFKQFPQTFDVGIIQLSQPVVMSQYGLLPAKGELEQVAGKGGNRTNRFTAVGYGQQGEIRPFYSGIWERYKGTVRLIELKSTYNGGASAKFTNNPGMGGGTCFGDSGGPIFFGDSRTVAAVISFGITPCIGTDYNFRMDTDAALDFVRPYLP